MQASLAWWIVIVSGRW